MSKNKGYYTAEYAMTGFFLLLFVLLLSPSCKEEPTQAEVQYLDSLQFKINGNEKALSIDADELVRRKDHIREYWLPIAKDTVPEVAEKLTDDMWGMISVYDTYLNNHLLLVSANKLLAHDLELFREETKAGEYSREEFKKKYKEMDHKVIETAMDIQKIARPVYDLEPMWLRFSVKFDREGQK